MGEEATPMFPQNRPSAPAHTARVCARRPSVVHTAAAVLALTGTLCCNTLLDIEEATLCEGSECATAEATPGFRVAGSSGSSGALESNAEATDAGVRGEAPTSSVVGADPAPPVCAAPTPELARDCSSCGGSVACDGRCDVALPPNLGASCGSCGGTINCDGGCSVVTPSDYGSILPRDTLASFSCCLIDEVRSYGPDGPDSSGCYPGYVYDGCSVSKVSGYGSVSIVEEDAAACTCRVHVENQGLDGATYTVSVRLKRACQPE
jgi:hypothetical protein